MELIERESFFLQLQTQIKNVEAGEGHCVFISGEAGIGKTALVKKFCREQKNNCNIYEGACDALFTPRPLAPFYDISWQVSADLLPNSQTIAERSELFTLFFRALANKKQTSLIIFEDIHWADEATLDFIKYFARRITQLGCLFILTYRDDEIHSNHMLRNILGQLPAGSFSSMQLTPLSRQAVGKMAEEKKYNGEDVYGISGGNPFYVNEILASYSKGVPANIKNAILSVYNSLDDKTKQVWNLLSVIPAGFEIRYLEKFEPSYADALENCLGKKILIINDGHIFFKHELYRRTIEANLSALKRISLNKNILGLLQESFEKNNQVERIIHHAKNANEYDAVVHYAPRAARQAAAMGAHIEASKLYLTAIEYYQGNDKELLIQFYESYAYECYLTNQVQEAIDYTEKALDIWKQKNDKVKTGNCLRFLSRLYWLYGNRKKAEQLAEEAIVFFKDQSPSKEKAMAFSNMSQLKMLSDQIDECLLWGELAIAMAKELHDDEILAHALNNVGSMQMHIRSSVRQGLDLLQQSLAIALKNSYHEHIARAYSNIGSNAVIIKDYPLANDMLETGMLYCEEMNLDSWTNYFLSWKARMKLETGHWDEASSISGNLVKKNGQTPGIKIGALIVLATITMRSGNEDQLPLLKDVATMAFETKEMQRIIPVFSALLEYEWITGKCIIESERLDYITSMLGRHEDILGYNDFIFWLYKARKMQLPFLLMHEENEINNKVTGHPVCLYKHAITLFEGGGEDKRKAISIINNLGAHAVYEKMKLQMRNSGIKNIPRGIRKSTRANPAWLTGRELDVLQLLKESLQNKEIGARLFISPKTVDHHISSILFKLEVNSRAKAVREAVRLEIVK